MAKQSDTGVDVKNSFLERNQNPYDKRRTHVIELFIRKAGDKLADVTEIAEQIAKEGKSFERSLADALEVIKIR